MQQRTVYGVWSFVLTEEKGHSLVGLFFNIADAEDCKKSLYANESLRPNGEELGYVIRQHLLVGSEPEEA